ncbi:hypothetical protein PSDI105340_02950 [Pseudoalteromonas distincta]
MISVKIRMGVTLTILVKLYQLALLLGKPIIIKVANDIYIGNQTAIDELDNNVAISICMLAVIINPMLPMIKNVFLFFIIIPLLNKTTL